LKFKFGPDALTRLGNPQKIRVRSVDHGDYVELQVRPTDRGSAVNMPKSEQLVDVDEHGVIEINDNYVEVLPGHGESLFVAQTRKHGWYALTVVKPTGDDSPVVTYMRFNK
jgi:hypothetical protein